MLPSKPLFSVQETCELLGISRSVFYKLVNADQLRPVKLLGRTLVKRGEIERFIEALDSAR